MKIAPAGSAQRANSFRRTISIRREAVEILRLGIVIRIARQNLLLAMRSWSSLPRIQARKPPRWLIKRTRKSSRCISGA